MTPPEPHDPFEKIEQATNRLARRVLWEQGNRIGLLRVHAVVAMLAGFQMLAFGGPYQLEELFGPITRMILGPVGVLGGVLLELGLRSRPRSITLEALGLMTIGLWDLSMTLGLAYARLHTTSFGLGLPWLPEKPPSTGYVVPYPIAVYAGLFLLIVIHLWTLRKLKKAQAPPAGDIKKIGKTF